jgi:hypothetical protein
MSEMNEKDRQWLLVGYFPQTDRRMTPGSKILLDPVMSAGFEVSIESAGVIDPQVFSKHLSLEATSLGVFNESRCKAQIKVQAGVTDVATADVLTEFYINVEKKDWEKIRETLADDMQFCVPAIFKEIPQAGQSILFLGELKKWCDGFAETFFNIEWANISINHAMVKFQVICDDKMIVDALSEYKSYLNPFSYHPSTVCC